MKKEFVFGVITKVPVGDEPGNLFDEFVDLNDTPRLHITSKDEPNVKLPKSEVLILTYGSPVFEIGEILSVLKEDGIYGREVDTKGRKPSKWCVDFEVFDKIEDAVAKSREVAP